MLSIKLNAVSINNVFMSQFTILNHYNVYNVLQELQFYRIQCFHDYILTFLHSSYPSQVHLTLLKFSISSILLTFSLIFLHPPQYYPWYILLIYLTFSISFLHSPDPSYILLYHFTFSLTFYHVWYSPLFSLNYKTFFRSS